MAFTKQVSLHGKRAYVTTRDQVAGRGGFVAGGDDKPSIAYPAPDVVATFTDFIGYTQTADTGVPISNGGGFGLATGDTGHANGFQAVTNGVFRIFATPTVAAKTSAGGVAVKGRLLQWKGNQGAGKDSFLHLAARIKRQSVSRTLNRTHLFVGFTDIASYEFPAYDTGGDVISAPNDYMGIMGSPGGDTGYSGVAAKGVAGDSGDQVVALEDTATDNVYDVLEMIYQRGPSDTGGAVTFLINGVNKGRISSPVQSNVALTPCVYAFLQDTGTGAVDIDWIAVSASRDTGE
jgi:hypothetical protein